jgi:SAM-dependent methyltransferase
MGVASRTTWGWAQMNAHIVDYDGFGYDYRTYWTGRDYEQWAEDRVMRRLVPRLGRAGWFIDFGGGFGRNAAHYRDQVDRYVIADYSATNLSAAAQELRPDVDAGRTFLVRCDLAALPFADHAFDAAIVVRVLHHLTDLDGALAEMGRTVSGRWLLDVPIKHHALGLLRGAVRRDWRRITGPAPLMTGTSRYPFWNFQLTAVRELLAAAGWRTKVAASVNNLRRWDRRLPGRLVRTLAPGVRLAELAGQRGGRGWWGPNQFLLADRAAGPSPAAVGPEVPPGVPAIAGRMACPHCHGVLDWTPEAATCPPCAATYPRVGAYWDFTADQLAKV